MHQGHYVFAQLMQHLPLTTFRRCVARYNGEYRIQQFSCLDQFLCMAFAQLTCRESLRDIEACLRAQSSKLYHMGIHSAISRSTLAHANAQRDWRIYADFAQILIQRAKQLYGRRPLASTSTPPSTPWTPPPSTCAFRCFRGRSFERTKAAVKLHTLLNLQGDIPEFILISDGKLHDVNVLDHLLPVPGAYYVMDRGYLDFERLAHLMMAKSFFVTRAKRNFNFAVAIRTRSTFDRRAVRSNGCLEPSTRARAIPEPLRRIVTTMPNAANVWCSSPTISPSTHSPLPRCTSRVGGSNCSSSGSSSTCASRCSTEPARTPSNRKSGLPCPPTCSWRS